MTMTIRPVRNFSTKLVSSLTPEPSLFTPIPYVS
jgi:hypothetical protein